MAWMFSLGDVHLVNMSGRPSAGGDPRSWLTTPFSVLQGWTPNVAKPNVLWLGGPPMTNGQRPLSQSYNNVDETIGVSVVGRDADEAAQALQLLKRLLGRATTTTPIVWRHRPEGASNDVYAEVYAGSVQESIVTGQLSPVEGWPEVEATITLNRSPFFGADALMQPIAAVAVTNDGAGNVVSLGDSFGDMSAEGQPLNVTLAAPPSSAVSGVILATVVDRVNLAFGETLSGVTSQTDGEAYSYSSDFDIAALRRLEGAELRILARLSSLTYPGNAELSVEIQTSAWSTLWQSSWVRLGSDTTAQLIELGGAPLTNIRMPLPASTPTYIHLVARLRSADGTAVSATLDYLDALMVFDYCAIDLAGLNTSERLVAYGAQNLSGGGWLPMARAVAAVFDASDIQIRPATVRGQLVRFFDGASIYVAWVGSGRYHLATDTSALTVDHAPLWRSLRGIT